MTPLGKQLGRLMPLLAGALCLLDLSCILAYEYEVDGRADFKSMRRQTEVSYAFSISVSNCLWKLAITDYPLAGASTEVLGDGQNVYFLTKTNKFANDPNMESSKWNFSTLRVVPGEFPIDQSPHVPQIWLAYASQCYFASDLKGRARQVWEYDDVNLVSIEHTLPTKWAVKPEAFGLPANVVYANPGEFYVNREGQSTVMPAPAPYNEGFTNFIYEVVGFTNVLENVVLPREALFSRFSILQDGKSKEQLRLLSVSKVTCHFVRLGLAGPIRLEIPKRTFITDYRYRLPNTLQPLTYMSKLGVLLSEAEIKKTPDYQSRILEEKAAQIPTRLGVFDHVKRAILMIWILCISVVSLVIMHRLNRSNK